MKRTEIHIKRVLTPLQKVVLTFVIVLCLFGAVACFALAFCVLLS